jgi:hypothetical protein
MRTFLFLITDFLFLILYLPAMPPGKTLLFSFLYFIWAIAANAQLKPVYSFQKDDTALRQSYYDQALKNKNDLVNSLGKQYKDDYKQIYEARFDEVADLLKTSRTVTAPEAHAYLQTILKKIVDANPGLKNLQVRLVFTRDWWPNAYSMGEGTLAVNAGLVVFLDNEAQLAFAICHELAHFYLDHSNKEIKKNIETINSDEFKAEVKRLSKQQYRVGQQLEDLIKKFAFGSRRHSRENEAEADRQGFVFLKRSGYDCNQVRTCLQLLDKIDDTTLYKPLAIERLFDFKEYPFKKRWIENESAIFSAMGSDDSPLTQKEKDSLKTHPDCTKRISLLEDSVRNAGQGQKFIVNEDLFRRLKKEFLVEMTEQEYKNENLGHHLYLCLLMLQNGDNVPYAAYSAVKTLNKLYDSQKNHRLGIVTDKESRVYPADYNLLLRMLDRLHLDELANIDFYFCKQYSDQMVDYEGYPAEMRKAFKIKSEN